MLRSYRSSGHICDRPGTSVARLVRMNVQTVMNRQLHPPTSTRLRVLAVDDDPVIREAPRRAVPRSGFGGAIASLRLGEAGIETIVFERGRRWPITAAGDTFCTKENPDGRAAWLSSTTILPAPIPNVPIDVYTGVLDRKIGNGVIAYRGAGVGGGSLMYGCVTYQPTKELFYRVFPNTLSYDDLDRVYYPRVRAMLHATPIPDDIFNSDAYLSSRILLEQATKAGLRTIKPDIAIDWDIVRQEIAGRKVPSGARAGLPQAAEAGRAVAGAGAGRATAGCRPMPQLLRLAHAGNGRVLHSLARGRETSPSAADAAYIRESVALTRSLSLMQLACVSAL
jgi:choline dehydrogenase-like flavoprotein